MAYKNYKKKNYNDNNRKMSNKTKKILTTVVMILLIFGLLAGVFALINAKTAEEGYDRYNVTWKSGGISTEDGAMVIDKAFMYSSAIEVDTALLIRREYASNVSYMVFYYNEVGEVVYMDLKPDDAETNGYTCDYLKSLDELPCDYESIDHARIVMQWTEDDDDELSYFERLDLSNKIRVYVAEETVKTETEE